MCVVAYTAISGRHERCSKRKMTTDIAVDGDGAGGSVSLLRQSGDLVSSKYDLGPETLKIRRHLTTTQLGRPTH